MRTRFYVAGLIILLLAFSISIYSQQTGAARRQATNAGQRSRFSRRQVERELTREWCRREERRL